MKVWEYECMRVAENEGVRVGEYKSMEVWEYESMNVREYEYMIAWKRWDLFLVPFGLDFWSVLGSKWTKKDENIVLRSLICHKYRVKTSIFYDFWRMSRNIDIYGTSGLTLTPFWRPRAQKHRYLRWISASAKTCTIKEREARQWGSVSLHVSDWRFLGACGHEAVGAGKCKSIMTPRVWEHESIRAWCHANRISRSYRRKRAQ